MSKSRGNIIYPKDMIERGCQWQHIRFFLINGYYRKRLNFTFKKFKKACARLQEFKDMVNHLQSFKTNVGKSNTSRRVKELIAKMKNDFEANMNNDLHVKDAFDALFRTVSKLVSLAEKGKVYVEDIEKAVSELKKIDQVMQVIF
jgi:cysteinyl-tRNA synthetase